MTISWQHAQISLYKDIPFGGPMDGQIMKFQISNSYGCLDVPMY
jgi:hypothetical protein